jgi:DoxX-like family
MSTAAQIVNPRLDADRKTMLQPRAIMNIVLWTVQVLLGVFFSFTGFGKILCINQAVWNMMLPRVPWFSAVGHAMFVFVGLCEFLGGVGLILPAISGVKSKLTPLAAFGLTLVMIFAAIFHVVRGEYQFFLPINLVLAAGAAFIAYGRWFVRPLAPASISVLRTLAGFAVLAALVSLGAAPVWYQLTHTH